MTAGLCIVKAVSRLSSCLLLHSVQGSQAPALQPVSQSAGAEWELELPFTNPICSLANVLPRLASP